MNACDYGCKSSLECDRRCWTPKAEQFNIRDALAKAQPADPRPAPIKFGPKPVVDEVNHPPHYTAGKIECIDAIQAALTPEEFRGYCKGNSLKYVWRERNKGGNQSVEKAQWYLARALTVDKQ